MNYWVGKVADDKGGKEVWKQTAESFGVIGVFLVKLLNFSLLCATHSWQLPSELVRWNEMVCRWAPCLPHRKQWDQLTLLLLFEKDKDSMRMSHRYNRHGIWVAKYQESFLGNWCRPKRLCASSMKGIQRNYFNFSLWGAGRKKGLAEWARVNM